MAIQGQMKVGDKVYRALSEQPYEVIAIVDGKVHIKRGREQRLLKITSMTYGYTIVGTASDIKLRQEFTRHGYFIWQEPN